MTRKLVVFFVALGLVMTFIGVAAGAQQKREQQAAGKFKDNDGRVSSALETGVRSGSEAVPIGDQHGTLEGHLPKSQKNVKLISKLRLTETEGAISDVNYGKGYAYLGVYYPECDPDTGLGGGVHVVDVRDPQNPEDVAFIPSPPGNYVSEGVDFFRANTATGERDLLLMSNEICPGSAVGDGGINIWDVTDPENPVMVAEHAGDGIDDSADPPEPYGYVTTVHSVMGWNDNGKSYAVLVDNEELLDVDILDITNPAAPVLISESGLPQWPDANVNGYEGVTFHHDMWVKKIDGTTYMMVSYWDAGQILLDVDDPENPVYVDDQDFPEPDQFGYTPPEGNAHQGTWSENNRLFIETNEDFSPYRIEEMNITTGPNAGSHPATAVGGGAAPALLPDKTMNGPIVYGGYGCPSDLYPGAPPVPQRDDYDFDLEPGEDAILVLQRGPNQDPTAFEAAGGCFPGEKAHEAHEAGWDAVLLVNRHHGDASLDEPYCGTGAYLPDDPPIVTVCTTHEAFHKMFNTTPSYEVPYCEQPMPTCTNGTPDDNEPDIGDEGEKVSATSEFDGWGDVRLLDADTLEEIDAYAVEEAKDARFASGFGDLSVHEVKTDQRQNSKLGYLSYYSAGLRVIRANNDGIKEMGIFIAKGGNNFWGVFPIKRGPTARPLLLLSDRDYGLFILKYTGPEPGPVVSSGACKGMPLDSRTDRKAGGGKIVVGTEGDDVLNGTAGNDIICGLGGDDVIAGEGGADEILGNDGNDTISGGTGKDSIRSGSGRDAVDGNDDNDLILGGSESDSLRGNGGWDTLRGGSGKDTMQGGDGDDVLRGGADDDILKGGDADDELNGEGGTDTCEGGGDSDTLRNCEG